MRALIQGDIDVSGTVDAIKNEHINLVKDVYQAFPFRYVNNILFKYKFKILINKF
jgi:hypothetical protein